MSHSTILKHPEKVPETTYRLVSFLDMTQERKAQKFIRENEARHRSLVDNTGIQFRSSALSAIKPD